jgi:hypothetical protein
VIIDVNVKHIHRWREYHSSPSWLVNAAIVGFYRPVGSRDPRSRVSGKIFQGVTWITTPCKAPW